MTKMGCCKKIPLNLEGEREKVNHQLGFPSENEALYRIFLASRAQTL